MHSHFISYALGINFIQKSTQAIVRTTVDCDDDETECAIHYYMVLIIVLFKYVFYIFTIKYLIVFGLPYKYINCYKFRHQYSVFKI